MGRNALRRSMSMDEYRGQGLDKSGKEQRRVSYWGRIYLVRYSLLSLSFLKLPPAPRSCFKPLKDRMSAPRIVVFRENKGNGQRLVEPVGWNCYSCWSRGVASLQGNICGRLLSKMPVMHIERGKRISPRLMGKWRRKLNFGKPTRDIF